MSATIIELGDGATGQVSDDRRTLRRVLSVDSSTALTVVDVLALTGIPVYGDAHPLDANQFCQSVSPRSDDGGYGWIVDVEYGTKTVALYASANDSFDPSSADYVGSGFPAGSPSTWASDDPCRMKWQFELGYERVERQVHKLMEVSENNADIAIANPSINTANRLMKGGVKESRYVPVLQLSKSVPDSWTSPNIAATLQGSVNSSELPGVSYTIPKYGAQMRTFSIRRGYWGKSSTPYWEVRMEILCMYAAFPDDGAKLMVLQYDIVDKNDKPLDVTNNVMGIGLLGSDGLTTTTPYYRYFRPSSVYNWNLIGIPKKV